VVLADLQGPAGVVGQGVDFQTWAVIFWPSGGGFCFLPSFTKPGALCVQGFRASSVVRPFIARFKAHEQRHDGGRRRSFSEVGQSEASGSDAKRWGGARRDA